MKPLHYSCNILLPFNTLTRTLEEGPSKPKKPVPVAQDETDTDSTTDRFEDKVDEQSVEQSAIPKYIISARRSQKHITQSRTTAASSQRSATPSRR